MARRIPANFMKSRRQFIQAAGTGASAAWLLRHASAYAGEPDFPQLEELRAEHEKRGMVPPNKTYRMMEWEFHTPPKRTSISTLMAP